MRACVFRSRRLTAFVQLLLFAVLSSTSLLPCAHESTSVGRVVASTSPRATAITHAMHHEVAAQAPTPETGTDASRHHGSSPSSAACPWVVGCVGMVRVEVDAPWRAIENVVPRVEPDGVTLRRVTVDRDVESPPPRG